MSLPGCIKDAPSYSGTVCLDVRHHGQAVSQAEVYRRGGGERSPGFAADMLSLYDAVGYTGDGSSICFTDLRLGKHFFAAIAYDELIRDSVLGTLTLDLSVREERVDSVLQVSETH